MGFENELASYEPLRRILDSEKVNNIKKRFKICHTQSSNTERAIQPIQLCNLSKSDYQPDMILAIDGSYHPVTAENGFPGAEFGYITVASVLILVEKIKKLEEEDFIDPKKFRETEKASTIDSVFPGFNVILDDEKSAKTSMRKLLFEELKNSSFIEEGENLLDTYEALLEIKLKTSSKPPLCPNDDCESEYIYKFGEYECPFCGEKLFSTDAMRLHELMNPIGTNGELYGQIMQTLEKLWFIHILRAFEKKDWLSTLRRIAFILDGPLAVFSTSSWLMKSISSELIRINEKAKAINKQDLLILGIEKTGTFVNHFESIDTSNEGISDQLPKQSVFLLTDDYIKKNIIYSESQKPYGLDTYFGRKFFYKTSSGYNIVASLPFFNQQQQDIRTALPNQFPRLADAMTLLDKFASSRFKNSISPLISAHAEAAIPLNLGRKIFEDIAKEMRERT